jgi:hypothetical protein
VTSQTPSPQQGAPMNLLPVKPNVGLDDLNKLDIRVGTIRSVSDGAAAG